MLSNFITPPDFIETVLIIDASQEQIFDCGQACANSELCYNVYFYDSAVNNQDWLSKVCKVANVIMIGQSYSDDLPANTAKIIQLGQKYLEPKDFFINTL